MHFKTYIKVFDFIPKRKKGRKGWKSYETITLYYISETNTILFLKIEKKIIHLWKVIFTFKDDIGRKFLRNLLH